MIFSNGRFSLNDNVLSIVYISLLEAVLKSAGYTPEKGGRTAQDLTDFQQRISPAEYMETLERMLKPTAAIIGAVLLTVSIRATCTSSASMPVCTPTTGPTDSLLAALRNDTLIYLLA